MGDAGSAWGRPYFCRRWSSYFAGERCAIIEWVPSTVLWNSELLELLNSFTIDRSIEFKTVITPIITPHPAHGRNGR